MSASAGCPCALLQEPAGGATSWLDAAVTVSPQAGQLGMKWGFFCFFFSPFAVERSNFPTLLLSSSALVWAALTDAFISQTEMK